MNAMLTCLLMVLCLSPLPESDPPLQPAGAVGALDHETFTAYRISVVREALEAVRRDDLEPEDRERLDRAIDTAAEALTTRLKRKGFPSAATWNHAKAIADLDLVNIPDPLAQAIQLESDSSAGFRNGPGRPNILQVLDELEASGLPDTLVYRIAYVGRASYGSRASDRMIAAAASVIRANYPDRAAKRHALACLTDMVEKIDDHRMIDTLKQQLDADPPADAWVMHAFLGAWHTHYAWVMRGGRSAAETTDQQFEAFFRQLALAREHLTDAYEIDPDCPEPAALMISVVMGAGSGIGVETEEEWFRRAYEAQPDYPDAYSRMRMALYPRWGGSIQRLRDFAEWCAQDGRHEGNVGVQAWHTLRTLASEEGPQIWQDAALVERVRAIMTDLAEQDLQTCTPWYCRSVLIEIDAHTGNRQRAAAGLRELGGSLGRWRHRERDRPHRPYGPELLPLDTPAAPEARLAESAEATDDWASAARLWSTALEKVTPENDPIGHIAIRERLVRAERSAALRTGDWIDLPVAEDMLGFRPVAGAFSFPDGAIVMNTESNESHGPAVGLFDLDVHGSYEIECDAWQSNAGLVIGWSEYRERDDRYLLVRVDFDKIFLRYSMFGGMGTEIPVSDVPSREPFRLRVRVEHSNISVWINDVLRHEGPVPSPWIAQGTRVGIGGHLLRAARDRFDRGDNRVANVRLRLLEPAAALPAVDSAEEEDEFIFDF